MCWVYYILHKHKQPNYFHTYVTISILIEVSFKKNKINNDLNVTDHWVYPARERIWGQPLYYIAQCKGTCDTIIIIKENNVTNYYWLKLDNTLCNGNEQQFVYSTQNEQKIPYYQLKWFYLQLIEPNTIQDCIIMMLYCSQLTAKL